MVGYGPEDDHFVAELTYNYGVGEYKLGNDFLVRFRITPTLSARIVMNNITVFFSSVCIINTTG